MESRRNKKVVDYKKLAGLSEEDEKRIILQTPEPKPEQNLDDFCSLCGFLRQLHKSVSKDVLSNGFSILETFNQMNALEISFNFSPEEQICIDCFNLVDNIILLERQLNVEKARLSKLVNFRNEILFDKCKIDIMHDPTSEAFNSFLDDSSISQDPILKLTEIEMKELKLEFDDHDDSGNKILKNLTLRMVSRLGGKFTLNTSGSIIIQSQGVHKQSITNNLGFLVCGGCDAAFDKFNDLMSHLNTCNCLLEQTYSFYCELCSLTFNNLSEYSAHSAATHDLPKNMPGESATTAVSSQMTILDNIHQRGPKNFKCDICGKKFTRKASMLEHTSRHKGLRDRECKICNKKFYNTSFWRHMATVHAQESKLVHECKICGRKFSFAFKLKLHQKSHLNYEEREYVCRKCPDEKRFATKNRFKTHEKQVHETSEPNSKGKLCAECGVFFTSASTLAAHRKRQHSNVEMKENLAKQLVAHSKFSTSKEMVAAVHHDDAATVVDDDDDDDNHDEVTHECSWCGLQFLSYEFEIHNQGRCCTSQSAPSDDPVAVPHADVHQTEVTTSHIANLGDALIISADEVSSSQMLLESTSTLLMTYQDAPDDGESDDRHLSEQPMTSINNSRLKIKGSTSGKSMSIINDFGKAMMYNCEPCGKLLNGAKAKNQHDRLVHSKGPFFTCNVCDKVFANNQYMKDHMKVHSDVKPFICSENGCAKSFRQAKDLTRHKRVHTGEKPYSCTVCGKSFSASSNLSEHKTLHTGQLPYQCNICLKRFRLWSTMRKHTVRCTAKNSVKLEIDHNNFVAATEGNIQGNPLASVNHAFNYIQSRLLIL